jgi:heavy metal translocating P-type ATPase
MNQAIALQSGTTPRVACLHCGSPVPSSFTTQFCCRGCESVFGLLQSQATPTPDSWAYLDDPEFLKSFSEDYGQTMRLYLEGVHCAACVGLTESLPTRVPQVESLRLSLQDSVAVVRLKEPGHFSKAARELERMGYKPHPVQQHESQELQKKEARLLLARIGVAAVGAGNIMLLAVALYAGAEGPLAEVFKWTSLGLFLPVILFSAVPFFDGAWTALKRRQVSIDVPIAFGLLVGSAVSIYGVFAGVDTLYFDSVSTLVLLLLSTRYLMKRIHQRSLSASQMIHFLAPSKAHLLRPGANRREEVSTSSLKIGDVIQVLPGECFPIDGEVIQGQSSVSCALLTGESLPVAVQPGTSVHAGTWNQESPLDVRVTANGAATRLGGILKQIEQGITERAPIVEYLDRVGQAFVASVFVLVVIGFFLGLPYGLQEAFSRAIAIAIIVCPCTFALATPLAFSLAVSRAAKQGILIKSAEAIERASRVKTVFLDKTGTLTYGDLRVEQWNTSAPEADSVLFALESKSAHPIAQAVVRFFAERQPQPIALQDFRDVPGVGVIGRANGFTYEVKRLKTAIDGWVGTQVGLYREGALIGELRLADQVRPDSLEAIQKLRDLGKQIRLVSGDSLPAVRAVGQLLNVSEAEQWASVAPEAKGQLVQALPDSLMIGDGANDAVALAAASVGMATQGGVEISFRAAQVYSRKPGVMPAYLLLVNANETMRVIRRNLVFAVLYNLVGIAAALMGHLSPLLAAVLMPASALTLVLSTVIGTSTLRRAFREETA